MTLTQVARLEWFGFLRRFIWHNTGFGSLRNIREYIENYEPRFEPTVIPIANSSSPTDKQASPSNPDAESKLENSSTKYYSTSSYQALYSAGELTPLAVVQAILPFIRRDISPPGEHSIAWFDSQIDRILAAAKASSLRYQKKCPLGPLDGIPTAVKDDYDVEGYRTTLGSVKDYTTKPSEDGPITSWCVRKLEESGAINLGKLSMHEFGLDTSGNNPNYGTPPNPYNSRYYPGGSSSGSAYAVSVGLIPIALGGDGGGSIRIPSSFCSVYGLKPTHGRVSFKPGVNHSNTCAVNGPIGADVQSLAALYQIMATPDPTSLFPVPSPLLLSLPSKQNKVLGIPETWFSQSTPAIQRLCRSFLDRLVAKQDYTLLPITIPFLSQGQIAHAMTVLTDAATLLPKTKGLTPANRIMIALGTVTPATDYLLAQKLRQLLMQHLAHLWQKHPGMIIVTPTTSCAGWPIEGHTDLKYGICDGDQTLKTMEYVWLANFAGLPSLTVPVGFVVPDGVENAGEEASDEVRDKIPVGLMGMGEWASESTLLQWGLVAESYGDDRRCRPPIWVDVIERAREWMKNDKKREH